MKTYTVPTKNIPLDDSWDVIVAGGGPSGCTAAAAAAREGAKTLLIETTSALGGMGTSGLVPCWCPFTDKEKIIYGGMAEKILKDCIGGMPHVAKDRFDWTPIDAELLKRLYDELVTESGASVLFNTFVTGLECSEAGTVETIYIANKAGLSAYQAKVFVDCTGDADIAAWAGAEFEKGDETGDLQAATHCFTLTNVDVYGFNHRGSVRYGENSAMDKILASGKYPEIPDKHACNHIVGPGAIGFNAGHLWDVDNLDPLATSKALVQGRKIAKAFRDGLAEFFPEAFADAHLTQTGSLLGIRETRRIICDYYLTSDDFLELRSFPDEICRNSYYIDVHRSPKSKADPNKQKKTFGVRLQPGESHGVPYRCLTPKGLKNVLVAGRSISTDRPVQGSTRVMPVCLCMGEAAGIAAAMAQAGTADVHAVDTDQLRSKLKEYGAYLP